MSSELRLNVRHLNRWWRHLVNAYEVKAGMVYLQVKLCDPCLGPLKWFVYHARCYTSALLYLYLNKHEHCLYCSAAEHRRPLGPVWAREL